MRNFMAAASGWLAGAVLLAAPARTADYVVIVNKDNALSSVTQAKFVRIFKAEVQEWETKDGITLVLPRSGSAEKNVLLERVYETDEAGLKRYWTTLIYQNRITEQPRALASSVLALRVVAKTRGAIAVIPAADFDETADVKVLAIDDKKAGEPGYWLNDDKQSSESARAPVGEFVDYRATQPRRADVATSIPRNALYGVSNWSDQDAQEPKDDLAKRVAALETQLADNALAATAESDTPTLSIRGFGHVEFGAEHVDPDSGSTTASDSFSLGGLDLFLTSRLSPRISFLNETVFEATDDNETVLDVERLIIKYMSSDALNIQAGRFHTTLGWWNETYHHGEWLQTSIGRPDVLRFEDDNGVLPVHLVGLVFKGRRDLESCAVAYTLELGNGRGPTPDPPQTVVDANDSKALNLALSVTPAGASNLSFGGALYVDDIPSNSDINAGPLHGSLDESIENLFVVWKPGDWEASFEYFAIQHDGGGSDADSNGWYAQVARRFGPWVPYARIDGLEIDDNDTYYADVGDLTTVALGVRWDMATWNAIKLQTNWTEFDAGPGGVDEQRRSLVVQTAFSF